jgi:hypothetical protein
VVIWDNLNSHVSAAMTELAAARDWLTICQLPPCAHELSPAGLVSSHLKRSLASLAKRNLAQLTALVKTRLKRMQYRPALGEGFLASTGLDLTPFGTPRLELGQLGGCPPRTGAVLPEAGEIWLRAVRLTRHHAERDSRAARAGD